MIVRNVESHELHGATSHKIATFTFFTRTMQSVTVQEESYEDIKLRYNLRH
jgi:hypothetical protein